MHAITAGHCAALPKANGVDKFALRSYPICSHRKNHALVLALLAPPSVQSACGAPDRPVLGAPSLFAAALMFYDEAPLRDGGYLCAEKPTRVALPLTSTYCGGNKLHAGRSHSKKRGLTCSISMQ